MDKDLYELPPEEALGIEKVPASLDAVLDRLEVDHDYLLDGGVFTAEAGVRGDGAGGGPLDEPEQHRAGPWCGWL